MSEKIQIALARNKENGHIYQWKGENNFTNLSTGKEGKIPAAIAQEKFEIPISLNLLVNENPFIFELIKKLQLNVSTSILTS